MRKLLLLLLLAAGTADAGILRYTPSVLDSSADPNARVPQLIVADTAAECPSSDVGDGDLCYAKDTDVIQVRANAAWAEVVTGSVTLAGDVDGAAGSNDLDEANVEVELEGVLDLPDLQGVLDVPSGGTGAAPAADDQVLTSDSTSGATWRSVPDCNTDNMLTYTASTNTWGCEADTGAGGGGDNIRVEDGDDTGAFTAAADPDFSDQGDINFVLDTGATPDTITGLVRADSVALTTDTTGNYAGGDAEAGAALTGDSATAFFAAGTFEDALVDGSLEADEVNPTLGTQTQGSYVEEVQAGLGLAEAGSPAEDATSVVTIDHAQTLAGDPALNSDECIHVATATGGGFLCEGSAADTSEQLYKFPDVNGADTTSEISVLGQTIEDAELASSYSGVGTCTNQFARVLNDNAAPTCATVTRSDVSTSLITDQYAFTLYDPNGLADTDDVASVVPNRARAVTITEVWCESNDGTAVINLQRDDGSAADILSSNCTCGTGGTACTVDAAEDNLADGNNIDFVFVSETAVTRVNVQITYTVD